MERKGKGKRETEKGRRRQEAGWRSGKQRHLTGAGATRYAVHLRGSGGGGGADLSGFLPLSALTACLPHSGLIS